LETEGRCRMVILSIAIVLGCENLVQIPGCLSCSSAEGVFGSPSQGSWGFLDVLTVRARVEETFVVYDNALCTFVSLAPTARRFTVHDRVQRGRLVPFRGSRRRLVLTYPSCRQGNKRKRPPRL
jgi:hypothetical protein